MTTIGSTPYSAVTNRYAAVERSKTSSDSTKQIGPEAASTTKPQQSDKLATLMAELKELKKQQVNMSNRDYLFASLTLEEQISTERLNAGEDLDVLGVRFEGRVFNLAGKVFDPESFKFTKIADSGFAHRLTGVDIQV